MNVFKLIEDNGLNLHGDIEHFAELVAQQEREACAKLCENFYRNGNWITKEEAAAAIRARGVVHASDISQERVDETAKRKHEWVGLTDEEIKEIIGPWGETPIRGYTRKLFDQIEAKLKEKNT